MKYTNEFDEDLLGLTIETNDPWLDRKLNSHICYKKAFKSLEKPFRSGKTASKKAAAKVENREAEKFEWERQRYLDEKARLDPALKHAQKRFQDPRRQKQRDAQAGKAISSARAGQDLYSQLLGDTRGQRQAGLQGLRGLEQLQGYDQLQAGGRYSDAYRQHQDQAYEDLAKRLGTSNRDEAIASTGRLGALSGQRARRQGEQERAAREAAGALGAEAFQYGQDAAGQEFGRRADISSQLQGIGDRTGAQVGSALQGIQGAQQQAAGAEYVDDVAYINALKGQGVRADYDTSALNAANAAVAAGAKGGLHDAAVKLGTSYLSGGFNEGGGVYANAGYAAALPFLKELGTRAITGQSPEALLKVKEALMLKYPDATDEQLELLMKQEMGSQEGQLDLQDSSIQGQLGMLSGIGKNKGGYARMVQHSSKRRS